MSAISTVSLGLFGRLSILQAPREDVYERIIYLGNEIRLRKWRDQFQEDLSNIHSATCPDEVLKEARSALPPETDAGAVFRKALPTLLLELSGLVDAIVLSDEILFNCGFDPSYINELHATGSIGPRSQHPFSFFYSQLWPDEANQLREISIDSLPHKLVSNKNRRLIDAEILLDLPGRHIDASIFCPEALHPDKPDLLYIGEVAWIADDRGHSVSEEHEKEAQKQIVKYINNYLGEDWRAYQRLMDHELLPAELTRKFEALFDIPERSKALSLIGFYSELDVALQQTSLGVTSLSSSRYFSSFASQSNVLRTSISKVASRLYQDRLREDLEKFNMACLDLELPPFLRYSLQGANSLLDVLENAVKLHNDSKVINLRRYLDELANEASPVKIRRQLMRIDNYVKTSLEGLTGLTPAGLGFSTNTEKASVSLSSTITSAISGLLAWRNPAVLVQTNLQRSIGEADSLGDLARVFKVPRVVAADTIRKTKELQTNYKI